MESKSILKSAMWYTIFAMFSGFLDRIVTVYIHYTGETTLTGLHGHLFSFGTLFMLILFAISINSKFNQNKELREFLKSYNIIFSLMILMLFIRGVVQVFELQLNPILDSSIAIIAGASHILLFGSFMKLFKILSKFCKSLNE